MAKKTTAPESTLDAIVEPATAEDAIKALIEALGHDPATISSVEISSLRVRVLSKDRSLRTHRVEEWNAEAEEASGE